MTLRSTILASITILSLAGCETPEERQARETQFNGKTVAEVEARIGKADRVTATSAIWKSEYTTTTRVPVYGGGPGGKQVLLYYRPQQTTHSCTYTATLNAGRVVLSDYVGNDCRRFAPKLDG